jgi:hypothetical protein
MSRYQEKSLKKIYLKVQSGQIGSQWDWYHWIGLDKDIHCYRFLFFIFDLEYFIRVQSSEPLHAKMNPTSCLFGSQFACKQTEIFSVEPCSKNAGETSMFLGLQFVRKEFQHSAIQSKIEQHFGGFFLQIKVRKLWSKQAGVGFIVAWSSSKLWNLLNIQEWNEKIKTL